jgi:hypothetical protein
MGSTNTQIENYIRTHAPHIDFLKCYWANELPDIIEPGCSLIANYSSSADGNGGTHWVAMLNMKSENGSPSLFFDSFGKRPDGENNILDTDAHFKSYMNRHCGSFLFNHEKIQGDMATTCGHYAVLAIISQSIPTQGKNHGTAWKEYCSKYTTSAENDKRIREQIRL